MPAAIQNEVNGWICSTHSKTLEKGTLPLKEWTEDDVDIKISHCGVCGSDIHTLTGGWGQADLPTCVGHEITGKVVRVGKNVSHLKVGDRAGVGAQSGSCGTCEDCKAGHENNCTIKNVNTYNSTWPKEFGAGKALGGYGDYWRGRYTHVIKIPEQMTNQEAACFLCAGITTYAPMKRHNVKKGMKVGVIGIGGLGHFGVQWAHALGAETYAISHSSSKKQDAMKMGADQFVDISDESVVAKLSAGTRTFDFILCTSYQDKDFPWKQYLGMMKTNSIFAMVALPEKPTNIPTGSLLKKQIAIVGSMIGSPSEIKEMLDFAVEKGVKCWTQDRKLSEVNQVIQDMLDGKVRYRYVLDVSK